MLAQKRGITTKKLLSTIKLNLKRKNKKDLASKSQQKLIKSKKLVKTQLELVKSQQKLIKSIKRQQKLTKMSKTSQETRNFFRADFLFVFRALQVSS